MVQFSHLYMITGKTIALTIQTFVGKVMSLLSNILSGFVMDFLARSSCLLISWLQSPSTVIFEPKKNSASASMFPPSFCHEVRGLDAMILVFLILSFNPAFSLSYFTLIKSLYCSSSLSAIRVVSSAYLRLLIFLLEILIPACNLCSLAFRMMSSAYKLDKQGDNKQPCCILFSIFNLSVLCKVLTVASWPAYRFLRRQVGWSGIPTSLRVFHNLLWSIHFMANRWGNSGWLYFSGLRNHCRWGLQPWN